MPSLSNPWVLSFGDVKHLSSDLQRLLLQLIGKRNIGDLPAMDILCCAWSDSPNTRAM